MKLRYALLLAILFIATQSQAQSLTDGVRLMRDPLPVGARNTGMNNSLIAGVRDYTSLALNPAAIAPIDFREFGLTLYHRAHQSDATFLNTTTNAKLNSTDLGSLGFAFNVPTERGHLAFGISYDRVLDYSNRYSFSAVNENSSFLNTRGFIDDPGKLSDEAIQDYKEYLSQYNLAWATYLTNDIDSLNTALTTRLTGGLQESGTVTEEGGLNALRIGGGIDVAEGLALGATLNVLFGNYDYRRVLHEVDVNGRFSNEAGAPPNGFKSATITDTRTQDQTGLNLKLGLLAYPFDYMRFGLTIETPTWYTVEDNFYRQGESFFANGESFRSGPDQEPVTVNDYDVVTPIKIGAGVAFFPIENAMLSASVQYYDASQLHFENSDADLQDLNNRTPTDLRMVLSWSLGGEYTIPIWGVAVRAGYGIEPSPYSFDLTSDFDVKTFSAGVSVLLSKSIALEAAYRNARYTTDHVVYSDRTPQGDQVRAIVDTDLVMRNEVSVSFGYRF